MFHLQVKGNWLCGQLICLNTYLPTGVGVTDGWLPTSLSGPRRGCALRPHCHCYYDYGRCSKVKEGKRGGTGKSQRYIGIVRCSTFNTEPGAAQW